MANYPVYEGYKVIDVYNNDIYTPMTFGAVEEIVVGTSADEVLMVMPKNKMVKDPAVIGRDEDGLIVEWHYPDVILTLAYVKALFMSVYAVQQIQVKDVNY